MQRQCVVLFASEVAAAVGKNKYRHPVMVVESAWKRRGDSYQTTVGKLKKSGKTRVGTLADRIEDTRRQEPKVAAAVCFAADASEKCTDAHSLATAMKQLKIAVDSAKGSVDAEHHTEIKQQLESDLRCAYGMHTEPKALAQTAQENSVTINQCNDKVYRVALKTKPRVILVGRIDGMADNKLVEVKSRRYKFMDPPPSYDVIQMHCYMLLVNQAECTLIEQCKGKRKETVVPWDDTLWSEVTRTLQQFAVCFLAFMNDSGAQEELAGLPSEKAKREFWEAFCFRIGKEAAK